MELMIMGLQIILFLFLTIGVFCIVRQQKKANRCRRRLELYLKKHMDKPKKKEEKSVSPENVQNKNLHEDEELFCRKFSHSGMFFIKNNT